VIDVPMITMQLLWGYTVMINGSLLLSAPTIKIVVIIIIIIIVKHFRSKKVRFWAKF